MASCVNEGQVVNGKKTDQAKKEFSLKECMNNILYYNLQIDLNNYDSLSTYFFHEILDYVDSVAIAKYDTLKTIRWDLQENGGLMTLDKKKELELEIDHLKQELSSFKQVVNGYVFVHTFRSKTDTLSMIFVMDTECGYSSAIPIKTIYDPDPDKYSSQVRQIKAQ